MDKIKKSRPDQGNGFREYLNSYAQLYGNQTKKPMPPYGSQCNQLIYNHHQHKSVWGRSPDGQKLTLTIGTGSHAWDWAKQNQDSNRPLAILPPDESPHSFNWSFCIGHDPILIETAGEFDLNQVHSLAHELLAAGVMRVIHLGGACYLPQAVDA